MTRRDEHDQVSGPGCGPRSGRLAGSPWAGRPGWLSPRWLVVVSCVLAFAGLVGGVVYVFAAGGGVPAAQSRPAARSSPNPDSTEPVPQFQVPAQAVPVALPSTGAIPLPTTEQPQVTAWDSGSGGAALSAISTEASTVAQAAGLKEFTAMRAACSKLTSSVHVAQAAPPIPDTAMQQVYAAALSELGQAASACQAAISEKTDGDEYIATTENKPALDAAQTVLASASEELFKATNAIVTLSNHR